MNNYDKIPHLSKRLALCASFVRKGSRVADIGSDHALLPIYLVLTETCPHALASDINEGPIASAKRNILEYGVCEPVDTAIAPGLSADDPELVDDIIIAGMGGELIAMILEEAPWVKNCRYRFVLQPMTRSEKLRSWLFDNGFEILEEVAQEEGRRVYTVIHAAYSGEKKEYTYAQCMGGGLLGKDDAASLKYLAREAKILRKRAVGLRFEGDEAGAAELETTADILTSDVSHS